MDTIIKADQHRYYTKDGRTLTDMISGILNVSLGHSSDVVKQALSAVGDRGLVNCYDRDSAPKKALQEALTDFLRGYNWKLCNTGSEANERALQCVATLRGKEFVGRVLTFPNSFHGKSLTLAPVRYSVNWPSPIKFDCITEEAMQSPFDAVLYEPISGLNGRRNRLLPDLLAKVDHFGAKIIADEMVTGFYRCGSKFLGARQADFIVSGKGIGQGAPIAVLGIKGYQPDYIPTGWSTTASGNSISCEIAKRTLDHYELMPKLVDFTAITQDIWKGYEVRGAGALAFIKADNPGLLKQIADAMNLVTLSRNRRLMLAPCFNFPVPEFVEIMKELKYRYEDAWN